MKNKLLQWETPASLQGSNPCPHDETEKGIERREKLMMLDEAIEREKQMAEGCSIPCAAYKEDERTCESCRGYHKNLVRWLEELKEYNQLEKEGNSLDCHARQATMFML